MTTHEVSYVTVYTRTRIPVLSK